jgi:hypothetical protein
MPLHHDAQPRGRRQAVLGCAFVVALIVAALWPVHGARPALEPVATAYAQPANKAPADRSADKNNGTPAAPATTEEAPQAGTTPAPDSENATPSKSKRKRAREIRIDPQGVHIDSGSNKVRIEGLGGDREFDSFDQFVDEEPWLAGLVFVCVAGVFLIPLLGIVLVIWYKMRKTRLQNETMLKLAERGVPPEAIGALAAGATRTADPAGTTAGPGTAPTTTPRYIAIKVGSEQRASDLRKGVILVAVGLAFIFYWMINEGSASWLGLVLLFLGVGYCILWALEDRRTQATAPGGPPPASGT